jgi:hypothetical protein
MPSLPHTFQDRAAVRMFVLLAVSVKFSTSDDSGR